MERFVMMSAISDGRLYEANDMVRADTAGCKNCSHCCENMCDTIVLDPYDIYSLSKELGKSFTELLAGEFIEIGLHDLLTMPNIKAGEHGCRWLTEEKRCGVYNARPGICRLFPLGRYYHDETFSYFLQTHECTVENRSKVKVNKWLGIPELPKYEEYVNTWHYFVKNLTTFMKESKDHEMKRTVNVLLLKYFYETPYDVNADFYEQLYGRIETWRGLYYTIGEGSRQGSDL